MLLWILKALPWLARLSPALALVKGNWKIVSSVLTLVTMVAIYLWIGHLNNQIDEAEGNLMLVQDQLIACQMANDDQMQAIVLLVDANDDLAELIRVSHADQRIAEFEARERASQAASELRTTLQDLEELRNANPSCAELSQIDIGAVCPLVVERLRGIAAEANRQN